MVRKRKQYYVSQFNFKDVKEKEGKLYFNVEDRQEYPNSENLLYDLIYRIVDRKYDNRTIDDNGNKVKNTIPEIFISKAYGIDEDNEDEVAKYENAVRNGVYIDGIKYIYSQKSASMIRTQKTVFVRADLKDTLEEHIMLGTKVHKTVISKWLSNQGLLMSTSYLMDGIPNIVVIDDLEKTIIDDVKMVVPYEPTDEDKKEYKEILAEKEAEKERYQEYRNKCKEIDELFTNEYVEKNFRRISVSSIPKSRSQWTKEGKRVKVEELEKPAFYKKLSNGNLYLVYREEQTEEIKTFPIIPATLGYETKIVKNNKNEIEPFDGMGLVDINYMKRIERFLGTNTNAIQGRLPFIKGLFIKFDFKKYLKEELNTYQIKDTWGNIHNVDDIDILVTESCFKAKIDEDDEGNKHWLFKDMNDYYERLEKYGYTKFGIANYANNKLDKYAPTTYQLINALDLNELDLTTLAKEELKLIRDVIKRGDTASVKLFLDMVSSRENEDNDNLEDDDYKSKLDYIKETIELNERMVFDKEVQKTLFTLCESSMYEIMKGRIRIPSRYQYITGDIIGFLEWAAYRDESKVKGFLNKNEFYCKGMEDEEYILARYPLTHYSEVKIAQFIENNNPYMKHLHNIIQFNMYDLSMPQLAGCDFDGDTVDVIPISTPISDNRILKDAVIDDYVIVDPDDKALAQAKEVNIDTIWEFEKNNLTNLTGRVTNINTTICDIALTKGNLTSSDLAISTCKFLQGQIIDSAKTGQKIVIPEALEGVGKLPYFFKYIYGGESDNYRKPTSPLSKLCKSLEKKIQRDKIFAHKDEIGTEIEDKSYLDIRKIHELMIDESKYDLDTYFNLHDALTPIHNDFSTRRGKIYKISKDINRFGCSEEAKQQREIVREMYADLYRETRIKAIKATNKICPPSTEIEVKRNELIKNIKDCKEVYDLFGAEELIDEIEGYKEELDNLCNNFSILASVCTRIAYEDSKTGSNGINSNNNYLLPWICSPEGIIENLKQHEDKNKTRLYKLNTPPPFKDGIVNIVNGIGIMKGIDFVTDFEDIKGTVLHKEGNYYIVTNVEEKSNIETTDSPQIGNNELKTLENYPATLGFLQKDKEELQNIFENNKVTIDMEKGQYLSLFLEDEFLCSFTKNCIINKDKRIDLNKYVGQDVKVKVTKINNNSINVELAS